MSDDAVGTLIKAATTVHSPDIILSLCDAVLSGSNGRRSRYLAVGGNGAGILTMSHVPTCTGALWSNVAMNIVFRSPEIVDEAQAVPEAVVMGFSAEVLPEVLYGSRGEPTSGVTFDVSRFAPASSQPIQVSLGEQAEQLWEADVQNI
jgi:hypothetical protein